MKTINLFEDQKSFTFETPSLFTTTGQLIQDFQLISISEEEPLKQPAVSSSKASKQTKTESDLFSNVSVMTKPGKAKAKQPGAYQERQWMLAQAQGHEGILLLHKMGSKHCVLEPGDLMGVSILTLLKYSSKEHFCSVPDIVKQSHYRNQAPAECKSNSKTVKMIFSLEELIGAEFTSSKVWKFIHRVGAKVVVSPSLYNWVKREHARRQRQLTSFELPDVKDTRPIADQLELGLVLKCKKYYPGESFTPGREYIVSKVPDVYETDEGEAAGSEGTSAELVNSGGYLAGTISMLDNLDEYFETAGSSTKIYDPENCLPKKYPDLVNSYKKKLDKLDLPLFDHVKYDVVQSAVKNKVFNGKPMRMGKTSEALAWAMLRGSKKVAYIGPKNGRGVVAKEMARLGQPDNCVHINKFSDLEKNQDRWLELLTYDWLKRGEDPFRKFPAKHWFIPPEIKCPKCIERLIKNGTTAEQAGVKAPLLVRYVPKALDKMGAWNKAHATSHYGYRCPDKKCRFVDYERARYYEVKINDAKGNKYYNKKADSKGRTILGVGISHSTWVPPRYKRLRKRYGTILADEIHMAKDWNTLQTKALFGLKAKNHYGMTGTLMPNNPTDPYWPLHWIFGGGNFQFKYKMTDGASEFAKDFTQSVTVQNEATGASYVKRIPYLKSPYQFWNLMKDKMIRRNYEDPLVLDSFANAGLKIPKVDRKVLQVTPDTEQAVFLMASMADFEKNFQKYLDEIKAKNAKQQAKAKLEEAKNYVLNSSYVLGQMLRMRIAATCPGHLNDKLSGCVYKGTPGGAKMTEVFNLVQQKVDKDEKVLILSDFRYNQKLLESELAAFNPIRFRPEWSEDKRNKAIDQFQEDPDSKVFIAGPRSIGVAVDLSAASTCICTDLLWTPGLQQQAWSRILKPVPEERTCEVYIMTTKFSIDRHVYDTFYSKLAAAEQAFDRRVLSKKETVVDIKAFVDLILNDKGAMLQWLVDAGEDELCYVPVLDMLVPLEEREV